MYSYEIKPYLQGILKKLSKKNISLYNQVLNKINEIITSSDVEHYKNLRHDLKDFKRVQVGHFVLTFKYEKSINKISFEDFDHHEKIYKK